MDGHCAFLIARLNSNPSWEEGGGGGGGFAGHRVQTDRSGLLLIHTPLSISMQQQKKADKM